MQQLKAELGLLEPEIIGLDQRLTALVKREEEYTAREQALLNREGLVKSREDALTAREEAVTKRETATKTLRDDLAFAKARVKDMDARETEWSNKLEAEKREKNQIKARLGLFEAAVKTVPAEA